MLRILGSVLVVACLASCRTESEKPPPATKRTALQVSFRLDPRLIGTTYGGERWTSTPQYTSSAQPGRRAVVEAKVASAHATWIASDPQMVTVSPVAPGRFDHVRIAVNQQGESKLTVIDGNARAELVVRARSLGNATQAEIVRKENTP